MHDPVSELAREWLVRAERDLRVARYLLTMPDPPSEGDYLRVHVNRNDCMCSQMSANWSLRR
jgi:hypothetical protein